MQCLLHAEILSALRLEPNGQTAEYRWGLTASQSFLLCAHCMHVCVCAWVDSEIITKVVMREVLFLRWQECLVRCGSQPLKQCFV